MAHNGSEFMTNTEKGKAQKRAKPIIGQVPAVLIHFHEFMEFSLQWTAWREQCAVGQQNKKGTGVGLLLVTFTGKAVESYQMLEARYSSDAQNSVSQYCAEHKWAQNPINKMQNPNSKLVTQLWLPISSSKKVE